MDNNLKIALIGYGSMGKEIERIALEQNIEITDIFDIDAPISDTSKYNFDVAIDFSYPDAVLSNLSAVAKLNKNLVIGTTGWIQHIDKIKEIVENSQIGVIWGSNYSIGMQIFFQTVRQAAKLLNTTTDYDIMLSEMHHKRKIDSPSGTALTIGKIITEEYNSKENILVETSHKRINPNELHITSLRGGEIAGTHTVYIDSSADTIELTHRAKNRTGFAKGAILAAKWIHNKKGFYNFESLFEKFSD